MEILDIEVLENENINKPIYNQNPSFIAKYKPIYIDKKNSKFLNALITRFNLFFKTGYLLVCHSLRSFLFSASFSFITNAYSIPISVAGRPLQITCCIA
jgi:hypothetical protein